MSRILDAIAADLRHPLWFDARDEELAERHAVSSRVVRKARAYLRSELAVARIAMLADEAATAIDWSGTTAELLEIAVLAITDRGCRALLDFRAPLEDFADA